MILVTRSLRWIPAWAVALRDLPWVTPDATAEEVARAVGEALASRVPHDDAPWLTAAEGDTELLAPQAAGE